MIRRMLRPFALACAAALMLAGCVETRFESPLGDNIETCDTHWKGLWTPADDTPGEGAERVNAFYVDDECRFSVLDQPERGAPLKQIHVPLNYVHDGGNDYIVVSDAQLKGLVKLDPPHAVKPAPEKSFFFARYRAHGDRIDLYDVDSARVAKLVVDAKIEGTVNKTASELHVYVRGNRQEMLDIVRRNNLFADKAMTLLRRDQTVDAYERELIARQRGGRR
jgi:hypothetical protein